MELPVKTTKVKKRHIKQHVYIVKNENNEYLIEQRTQKLLNQMWEFPMYEAESNESIQQTLGQEISFNEKPVYTLKHQFTHITWDISVFVAESTITKNSLVLPENMTWMKLTDKASYNFPVSMTKIYNHICQSE